MRIFLRYCVAFSVALGFLWACPFDDSLRQYLDAHFWLPFSKRPLNFEKSNVRRVSEPFAGMLKTADDSPLAKLRAAYQAIPQPQMYSNGPPAFDPSPQRQALAAARADTSLSGKDREEVDLIDAKIDMRRGHVDQPEPLLSAKTKLEQFLKTARTPEFLSEARGWLAHVDYVLGDRTAAGKIYIDELNRDGSNLSRETLLTSLQMTYNGYDGSTALLAHLEDYFDTPQHAAFAIDLATNPEWSQAPVQSDPRIQTLLEKHAALLQSETGANALALLGMRTALRAGDPPSALKIAAMIPPNAAIRSDPDFYWMLASSQFLSQDYAAAEKPLLDLFASGPASADQKAAAAYGLIGVYFKLHAPVEQIHYALWLRMNRGLDFQLSDIRDLSIYWAHSGWDLNLLLESEASVDALRTVLMKYPNDPEIRTVQYSLAVRLARENQYDDAAQIYQSIDEPARATRMRDLAALYRQATAYQQATAGPEAKLKLAEFIAANEDRIYFNDLLWNGLQRYALVASSESGFTAEEHQAAIDGERQLKDDQEEYWQAYLILRDIVRESGKSPLGRQAAELAIHCLRRINTGRFGREDEIRQADIDLSNWVRQP